MKRKRVNDEHMTLAMRHTEDEMLDEHNEITLEMLGGRSEQCSQTARCSPAVSSKHGTGLQPHEQKWPGPMRLVLNITNRCNFKCRTCLRGHATTEDISLKSMAKFLQDGKNLGAKTAGLTGGEPILHPEFRQIISLHTKLGLHFGVVSNGWLYEDYNRIFAPVQKYVDYICISLDGHTAAIHDHNRRPGSFKRAVAAIQCFRQQGYFVRVSHILNRHNAKHLMAFMRMVRDLNVRVCIGATIGNDTNQAMQLTKQQLPICRMQLMALKTAYKQKLEILCGAGLNQQLVYCPSLINPGSILLRYDGKIVFCCDLLQESRGGILGDITTEPLTEILPRHARIAGRIMEERIRAMLREPSDCNNNCDFCNHVLSQETGK